MNSRRCAACKHLRRRCPSDCIFAPYFPSNNPRKFSYVHKIYGASNVGKILQDIPVNLRAEAVDSMYYEAYCRVKDPVYGSAGIITVLHQEIYNAECQLARIQADIAAHSSNNESAALTFFPDQNADILESDAITFFLDQNIAFNVASCDEPSNWLDH